MRVPLLDLSEQYRALAAIGSGGLNGKGLGQLPVGRRALPAHAQHLSARRSGRDPRGRRHARVPA